jgi:hypothetical protein
MGHLEAVEERNAKRELAEQERNWTRYTKAVARILQPAR